MKLVLVTSEDKREYLLGEVNSIGRHSTNTIQILDGNISKEHADILRTQDGKFLLRDKGSLNGTFIDGERVSEKILEDGDQLAMGSSVLQFVERDTQQRADVTVITNLIESHVRERLDAELSRDFLPAVDVIDPQTMMRDYEKLRIAHELTRAVAQELDEATLLPMVLEQAFRLLPAERGVIMMIDPDSGDLEVACEPRRRDGKEGEIQLSSTILEEVRKNKAAVLSADAKVDNRFDSAKSVIREGIRSTMCVPLIHAQDLLGIMHLDSLVATNAFSEKDLQILQVIATQAAVQISNCRMARRIEDEAKQRAVLGRLLSPNLVDQVMAGNLEIGSERREVTILFADIRGFSRMAERSQPEEIVSMLNSYFDSMVEILFRHGGTIDKYVGDEIMGLFGAPLDMEDGPLEAVLCAIDMFDVLKDFNKFRELEGLEPIKVGIGIDTGDVVCGFMGAIKTQQGMIQYTAIGDAVNTASRLCDMAKPGQILISQNTLDHVSGTVDTAPIGQVDVKGKDNKVLTFQVTKIRDEEDSSTTQTPRVQEQLKADTKA